MELLLAIPFGFAIAAVVGTVGGGGAILALPILVYVLDQGVGPASTAFLIVIALAASVGAGAQACDGRLCWRVAIAFSVPAAVGAYLGTLANESVDARGLILTFVPGDGARGSADVSAWRRAPGRRGRRGDGRVPGHRCCSRPPAAGLP